MSIPVTRLNHAVLFVADLQRSVTFYTEAFGFEEVDRMPGAAFLRSPLADNHHDLGLFEVGPQPPRRRGTVGLYHLAWEVPRVEDLVTAKQVLVDLGAYTGESSHGVSLSLYGADPDGNEFEIMWAVPRQEWGDYAHRAVVEPLDLAGEIAKRT